MISENFSEYIHFERNEFVKSRVCEKNRNTRASPKIKMLQKGRFNKLVCVHNCNKYNQISFIQKKKKQWEGYFPNI